MNKFNIIYADPPWQYKDKCNSGKRGVHFKYPVMNIKDLKKLNINSISEDNCALCMWVTAPQLPVGLELLKSWGFTYKTVLFTWIKIYSKSGKPCIGMGSYSRSNAEFVLLGIKGRLKRESASVSSVVISPREEHSKKPNIVRDKIVELFGDIPRCELFARQKINGWYSWGNEVECDFEISIKDHF